MDYSPYAQNPYATMMNWMNPPAPTRCEVCGRALAPAGTDAASQWYTNTYAPMLDNLTRMWSSMAQPWANMPQPWGSLAQAWMPWATNPAMPGTQTPPQRQPHTHSHHQHHGHQHDCDCERGDCEGCRGDSCHCRCCITDADLVVYARVGERRVVPLTIENPRRRERQVKLELSNWSSHGGQAGNVKAEIVGPAEFTLAACQEHETILLIEATPAGQSGQQEGGQPAGAANEPGVTRAIEGNLRDVDDCQVFYADLRVEGCEMRPVRIALALLPRDCAAHKVNCGCSCC